MLYNTIDKVEINSSSGHLPMTKKQNTNVDYWINRNIIARMLGHENVSTTFGFYAFATYEMMVEALKKTNDQAINEPIRYNAQLIDKFLYSLD